MPSRPESGWTVDTKLNQIMALRHGCRGEPAFNPAAVVGFVKDAGILIGMAAAAIIYISANLNSAPLAVMQVRMETISQRLGEAEDRLRWKRKSQVHAASLPRPDLSSASPQLVVLSPNQAIRACQTVEVVCM